MRVFLDTLPESSFAQAFRSRLGTLGFDTDASHVFYNKSINMAHQMANLEYGSKMYKLRDEMKNHIDTKNRSDEARMLFDVLDAHIGTMVAPDIAEWSKVATSIAFGYTLGGNISSVLVNMSQIPLIVMPYLGAKYGYGETNKAIGQATRAFMGSGLKRKSDMTGSKEEIEVRAAFSLDNYDFNAKGIPKEIKDLKELADLTSEYGMLTRSMTSDVLDAGKEGGALNKINSWMGFIFHHGERMNRQVALVTAYNLELGRMRKANKGKELTTEDRTAAAEESIRVSELLNGGASANSAPLLAKSSLGKIVFMYKRYGVSMYYMMFKTTKDAMSSEDPEIRSAAKRQIAGVYAMSAMMAGVQGVPMFGVVAAMYNLFGRDEDEDNFETAALKYLGEGMFNGAINALTGTAVSNRIGLTDLLLNSTGYQNQDNMILSLLQLAGGPVYGVTDRIIRGGKLISDGEVMRGMEQLLPSAFGNVLKGYRYGTEGANTLRGDPIVGEVGVGHSLAQAIGLAPAEYLRQIEINSSLKNREKAVKMRSELARKYFTASRNGDSDAAAGYIDDLIKLGEKHPGLVSGEYIRNSMAQHIRTSSKMFNGITLNPVMRNELLQSASEFDEE